MRLQEIITILKDTELKQIIVGEDDDQVYSLLNLALIDVYGKFDILTEEQLITMSSTKTRYSLIEKSQKVKTVYSKTTINPDYFREIPLNDINSIESVFTPEPFILFVPNPVDGKQLSVLHVVTPPYITKQNINTIDFKVPPQLLEPLVNYIGYRAYISMNGDDQTESSSHYRRYIRSCNDVLRRGLNNYSIITNTKQYDRGFPSI